MMNDRCDCAECGEEVAADQCHACGKWLCRQCTWALPASLPVCCACLVAHGKKAKRSRHAIVSGLLWDQDSPRRLASLQTHADRIAEHLENHPEDREDSQQSCTIASKASRQRANALMDKLPKMKGH